jgi:segregation and condensation protein B
MSDISDSMIEAPDEPVVPPSGMALDADVIRCIVEAALLASNQPLTVQQLYALFPEEAPAPKDSIEQALQALGAQTEGRGVELVEVASGFRYQVRAEVHPWVARLWTERSTRYTRATLETLALIAYRQPITRGEIEQIRGVAVSSNIIKLLEERDFIRVIGHRDVPGRPALFGTTKALLDYFGLKSLDELPPLADIRDLTDIEPQLPFEAHVAEAPTPPVADPESEDGAPGETASNDTSPATEDFPDLEDATDVVLDPTIPFIADADNGTSPHDADDDVASEHNA